MDLRELKTVIYEKGVVGAGGAGFPTHMKLNNNIEVVILNSCECEPLLKVDKNLISTYAGNILKALSLVVETVGAKKGIVALKNTYKTAIKAVEAEIEAFPELHIKKMEDVYPAGDEVVLVYETTGKIIPEGGLPIDVNAVVINTETMLNIYNAVFLNTPVTDTYVTVTGEVKTPSTLKVPIGCQVSSLLELAGGVNTENYEIIIGGPMTGKLINELYTVTKTTKAIIVLPKDHPVVLKKQINAATNMKRAMSVCSQCQMCTDLCPRALLGHSIQPHKIMNALANGISSDLQTYMSSLICSECGLCEAYSCHQGLSPSKLIGELKGKLRENGIKNTFENKSYSINKMREMRKVPKERLIARLSLTAYNVEGALDERELDIQRVKISLRQHIGAEAVPVVKVGDKVMKGQLIGDIEEGKLGAKIHASIDGTIISLGDNSITIVARGDISWIRR
jgi:Na+-translocating ferredoxin:NAD+ oxidoreductase RnfC subunit